MENNPLVSIVVITYNSAKFVLETLESAKNQTYHNIELIISDDGSKDDTVAICREWLNDNKERFINSELVNVKENTGTPANCNRGVKASKGKWIKLIAGDDLLEKNCIHNYIVYLKDRIDDIHFIFGMVKKIDVNGKAILDVSEDDNLNWAYAFNKGSANSQFNILLRSNKVWTATWMFTRELFNEIAGFDERFKCYEDRPFMLEAASLGHKIHFVDRVSAFYRIHSNSVQKNKAILGCFEESQLNYFISVRRDYFSKNEVSRWKRRLIIKKQLRHIYNNKSNIIVKLAIFICLKLNII